MRSAFERIGYEVFDLSGTVSERRAAFAALKARLATGDRPAFLYSENSTQPNAFATSVRDGFAPFLDFTIMRTMRRAGVPVGVFYRDAYWRCGPRVPRSFWEAVTNAFQRLDLVGYGFNRVHFFLPSVGLGELVGLDRMASYSTLPPAGEDMSVSDAPVVDGEIHLVYVGGLGAHYVLTEFLRALDGVEGAHLDLVTRKTQWETFLSEHPDLPVARVSPSFLAAGELAPVYSGASVAVLAVEPGGYWDIAVPVKLFEYLSYGRPVIATRGTEAARIVERFGAGWVVDHDETRMRSLLEHLRDHPAEIIERAAAARRAAVENTWETRAREASDQLTMRG